MDYIDRPVYMSALESYVDAPVVKVLTGIRRSGKSVLLEMLKGRLQSRGVSEDRIISLNFDEFENADLRQASALNACIVGRAPAEGRYYVFLDEVQEVAEWERVVNSLAAHGRADVYITGSNGSLLSSELATYISGRYVTIQVAPLSFGEFVDFWRLQGRAAEGVDALFGRYLRSGGFPGLFAAEYSHEQVRSLVTDIYSSIVLRDVMGRVEVRSSELFERVAMFVLDNVGSVLSANRISVFLKSQGKTLTHQTVADYLKALVDAFLLRRVDRYDVRGRAHLATQEKYFAGDHGIVNALLGYSAGRLPGLLENIVQAEMRLRGYGVSVGKVGDKEIDFIASRGDERVYLQVCVSALDPETRAREFAPLLALRDSFPKFVLSLDALAGGTVEGVRHVYLPEFLLEAMV